MKIRNILAAGLLAAGLLLTGCADNTNSSVNSGSSDSNDYGVTSEKPKEIDGFSGNLSEITLKAGDLIAEFEFEGFGTIKAVLFPEAAPIGVENFKKLADSLVKGGADDTLFGYDGGDKLIVRHVERGVIDLDVFGRHAL